ncbi:hypothetical protein A2U01_0117928, partial [Trifolium medium]|nr:hypothetical protein [Trifolium medium]
MNGAMHHRPLRDAHLPQKKYAACQLTGATRQYPCAARRFQNA